MSEHQPSQKPTQAQQQEEKDQGPPQEDRPLEEAKEPEPEEQEDKQEAKQQEEDTKPEEKAPQIKKEENKEMSVGQIVNEMKREDEPQPQRKQLPPVEKIIVTAPIIINPLIYYKCDEKYNWRVEDVSSVQFIEKLEIKVLPEAQEQEIPEDFQFSIKETQHVKGHVFYNVRVKDAKGSREVIRRYTEYVVFRSKLTQLWPCLFLYALPNKTLFGTSEEDLISNRSKYIIRFLRSLSRHQALYTSDEVQLFLNEALQQNMEEHFSAIPTPAYIELHDKYKKHYSEEYVYSQREQFIYRKQKIPELLEQYEKYFAVKKMDLMDSLTALRRLFESKKKYFKGINKLTQELLPEYEDLLYRWIYGEDLPEAPPSIMERMSRRTNADLEQTESKEPKESKETEPNNAKLGLYSTESYKTKFEDTALIIQDYNSSTYQMYNVCKFELKQIDSVLGSIQQIKGLAREMDYLRRTMTINKEQIQSLNSNKRTLKTFFMEGNIDDKKTKLANDNNVLEEQLQKLTELYYLILVLLENQLEEFHQVRARFYTKSMTKAFTDEIVLARNVMDFYVFEEQLFAKDRIHRIKMFTNNEKEDEDGQEIKE